MDMLGSVELLASDVVANATMNRGRGLSGVNSYQRELGFDIAAFLRTRVETHGRALWYDACCGEGKALAEAGAQFADYDWGRCTEIVGVDLVEMFVPAGPGVRLIAGDVLTWRVDGKADLITCVHGLHYLGDKLAFLERAYAQLAPGGRLLAHLDTANLRLPISWAQLTRLVRTRDIPIRLQNHRLTLERTEATLDFGLSYQGATVSAEPNYTGITVIDSWYGRHMNE